MPKTNSYKHHLDELENKILQIAKSIDKKIAEGKRAYLGTNNRVHGLTVPQQKELFKQGYSFSKLPLEEQLLIWDIVWQHGQSHESKMQALYWLSSIKDSDKLLAFWPVISKWAKFIDSWDTSDTLSSIFSRLLENAAQIVYPQLEKWNHSPNSWERRQSIVSLLYYSRSRSTVLPHNKILPLVERLIDDQDKFVQKGVGWTLRECHSVHPAATKQFIRKYATSISAIAFSAAAEKWPAEFLNQIKTRRKKYRR